MRESFEEEDTSCDAKDMSMLERECDESTEDDWFLDDIRNEI